MSLSPPFPRLAACIAVAVVMLAAVVCPAVSAWGCTGHMLVAEIAQRHLSMANRAKGDALADAFAGGGPFPRNPDMVQMACWADDLKSWHQYAMKPWHYVDMPYNPDNMSILPSPYIGLAVVDAQGNLATKQAAAIQGKATLSAVPQRHQQPSARRFAIPSPVFPHHVFTHIVEDDENGGNVVTSIRNMVVALKAHKVPIYSLTFAFANLVHFVGDVHQPLHTTTRFTERHPNGDRGGNAVKVKVDGVETNLHALWDNMCLGAKTHSISRPLDEEDYEALRQAADILEDTYKFSSDLLAETQASAMAWESHMFAINSTYPDMEEGEELSKEYLARCQEVTRARVTLAGRRLGIILNCIFDTMDLNTALGG